MIRHAIALTCCSLGLFAAETPVTVPAAGAPVSANAPVSAVAPVLATDTPRGPRVWLGVILEDGASFDGKPQPKVTRVIPGSTAEKLGLQPGDQVLQLGSTPLTSVDSFRAASSTLQVGETLTVKIMRGTQNLDLKATVEAPPRPKDVLTDADKLKSETAGLRLANERAATTSRSTAMRGRPTPSWRRSRC